jgi:hypothetical protein
VNTAALDKYKTAINHRKTQVPFLVPVYTAEFSALEEIGIDENWVDAQARCRTESMFAERTIKVQRAQAAEMSRQ